MILYDTPEFIAAEAAQKADQVADIRMGEYYQRERAKLHSKPVWNGDGEAGRTLTVPSIWTSDWSDQHEA